MSTYDYSPEALLARQSNQATTQSTLDAAKTVPSSISSASSTRSSKTYISSTTTTPARHRSSENESDPPSSALSSLTITSGVACIDQPGHGKNCSTAEEYENDEGPDEDEETDDELRLPFPSPFHPRSPSASTVTPGV